MNVHDFFWGPGWLEMSSDAWRRVRRNKRRELAMSETGKTKPTQTGGATIPPVGSPAPMFKLPSSDGRDVGLADFKGKQTVVLYFYPKADTPGCTTEACGFRDALADYDRANVAVLGISPDPIEDVIAFAKKFHLNFPLLADADHAVAERYGVWGEKNMYGRKYFGVLRTTFVIDRSGKIAHAFEKVKPDGHDRQVLEWIKSNETGDGGGASKRLG
jgi:peroxiredoxin Q/BCP